MRIVGIDLGTTHCAVASVRPRARAPARRSRTSPCPSWCARARWPARRCCPRASTCPPAHELAAGVARACPGATRRPARGGRARAAGRARGCRAGWWPPPRAGCATRAWTARRPSSRGARRRTWRSSPRSRRPRLLLAHLARAWDARPPGRAARRSRRWCITVPASFDEAARALTVSAARKAGLEKFTLLEEPQAAFYDFTARHRDGPGAVAGRACGWCWWWTWAAAPPTSRWCTRACRPKGPMLRRLAVGEHLMLGGDNMDAALAQRVEEKLSRTAAGACPPRSGRSHPGRRAPPRRRCWARRRRRRYGVSLVGRGQPAAGRHAVHGAHARRGARRSCWTASSPARARRSGPGARRAWRSRSWACRTRRTPAITRHLAAFLAQHAAAGFAALGRDGARAGRPAPPGRHPAQRRRLQLAAARRAAGGRGVRVVARSAAHPAARSTSRWSSRWRAARRTTGWCGAGSACASAAARRGPTTWACSAAADSTEQPVLCLIPRGFEEGQTGRPRRAPLHAHAGAAGAVPALLHDERPHRQAGRRGAAGGGR